MRLLARAPAAAPLGTSGVLPAVLVGLAGLAVWNVVRAHAAERRNPPVGRFLRAGGLRWHVVDLNPTAPGRPVLMLHGNGAQVDDLLSTGIPETLAATRRVVLLDRPGFGHTHRPWPRVPDAASQARAVADAISTLGLDRPVVVGHSWGGLVATALGVHHPGSVGGLVLLSGYHVPEQRLDALLTTGPAIPVIGDFVRYTIQPFIADLIVRRAKARIFEPWPIPPGFDAAVPDEMIRRPGALRAAAGDGLTMRSSAEKLGPHHGGLRMPVAILAGAEDRIVDPDTHSRALHRAVPGSTLRILPGVGHMMHHAVPDAVVAAVEEVEGHAA